MANEPIDIVAASRISRRVDLREIRLTEIKASSVSDVSSKRIRLSPSFDYDCVPVRADKNSIEVACSFSFKVRSSDLELAEAKMTYRIVYKLMGDEPIAESDLRHFARANGAYHSWPFVRETIYGLTAKMGFPPYTLPVLLFLPRPKPSTSAGPSSTEGPSPANDGPSQSETRE